MNNYKESITLNEKDSLIDLLNVEKQSAKMYCTALTEGTSKGFRTLIEKNIGESFGDQFKVFTLLCEHGYAKVQSAGQEEIKTEKDKFNRVKKELS